MPEIEPVEHKLWVIESNGVPRSGKGTITQALTSSFAGAASDETGADYRAVTFGLMRDGYLDPEMDEATVIHNVLKAAEQGNQDMADYAGRRYEIVAENATDVLHSDEVDKIVQYVSGLDVVRDAVKDGFARRVGVQVANDSTNFLFVDGRHLTPVINRVPGAEILLRFFVDCQPYAAAIREARAQSIDLSDPKNEKWYKTKVADIKLRAQTDKIRENDAVKVDDNAINYWFNGDLITETAERAAKQLGLPFASAAQMLMTGDGLYKKGGREGAGAKAFREDRQIYFDTTEIGPDTMKARAQIMVKEALDEFAGLYTPASDSLINADEA